MNDVYAIARYEQAASLLPVRWRQAARYISEEKKQTAEEFRLRTGKTMTLLLPEGEIPLNEDFARQTVTQSDIEQLCDTVTEYSRYTACDMLSQGFLSARGGFRVGFCGTAVFRDGRNTNLKDFSSAVIRIGREKRGLAIPLLPQLWEEGSFCSTLILSPPGQGKTTLLRDLIRLLSDGTEGFPARRVGVADERGEIAAMYEGVAQLDVGNHTDILEGCPKALAMPMLLRSANPQILAVDEITVAEDLEAISAAANCGVSLLATAHANGKEDLQEKPLFKELLSRNVFKRVISITTEAGQRKYRVSK